MARTEPRRTQDRPYVSAPERPQAQLRTYSSGVSPLAVGRSTMGVVNSLQGLTLDMVKAHQQQKAEQAKQQAGMAKDDALEAKVTGKSQDISDQSNAYRNAYHETEGMLAATDFESYAAPKIAELGPDADIDAELHKLANDYKQQAPQDATAQFAMDRGMAAAQIKLKQQFAESAQKEIHQRNVENAGALVTKGYEDGSLFAPGGITTISKYATSKLGLKHPEVNDLLYQGALNAMDSGKVDSDKVLESLKVKRPDGTPGLMSIPKYRQGLQLAAERAKKAAHLKWQQEHVEQQTNDMIHLNDLADGGRLGDAAIYATQKKWGLTPAWATAMHNRNREAQQRLARASTEVTEDDKAWLSFVSGDSQLVAMVGNNKVANAVNKRATKSYVEGGADSPQLAAIVKRSQQYGIPVKFIANRFAQFDPSNPEQAKKILALRKMVGATASKEYLASMVPSDTLAMFHQLDTMMRYDGMSEDQAIATLKSTKPIGDGKLVSSEVSKWASKQDWKVRPENGLFGSTWFADDAPDKNPAYVRRTLHELMTNALSTGRYMTAEEAQDDVMAKFRAHNIRVDGRWVYAGGVGTQAGPAISEFQKDVVKKLRANHTLGKDEDVYLWPDPQNRGRWVLKSGAGRGSAIIRKVKNKDGSVTEEPVTFPMSDIQAHYKHWKDDKDNKEIAYTSAIHKIKSGKAASRVKGIADIPDKPDMQQVDAWEKKAKYAQSLHWTDKGWQPSGRKPSPEEQRVYADVKKAAETAQTTSFLDYLKTHHKPK